MKRISKSVNVCLAVGVLALFGGGSQAMALANPSAAASPPPSASKTPSKPVGLTVEPGPLTKAQAKALLDALPACPEAGNFTDCVYGDNQATFFNGPDSRGPAAYNLYWYNTSWGDTNIAWPKTWSSPLGTVSCPPAKDAEWCAQFGSGNLTSGTESTAFYFPPAPIPAWDVVEAHINDPYSGGNDSNCGANLPHYTICQGANTGGSYTNSTFTLKNSPVTINITNELPEMITTNNPNPSSPPVTQPSNDNLIMSGQPLISPTFILDPQGGNPQKISVGDTGHFGGYLPVSIQAFQGLPQALPAVSTSFNIDPTSTDSGVQGASVFLSLVFNPKNSPGSSNNKDNLNYLDSSSQCCVGETSDQNLQCGISNAQGSWVGGLTVNVAITEDGSLPPNPNGQGTTNCFPVGQSPVGRSK